MDKSFKTRPFTGAVYALAACAGFLIPSFARAATTTTIAPNGTTTINLQSDSAVTGMQPDANGVPFDWGYMTEGAEVTYNLNFAKAGVYTVNLSYSSPTGGTGVNLFVNGTIDATVSFGNTGSYSTYTQIASQPISFPAGNVTFIVEAGYSGFNLAGVSITGGTQSPTPTPAPTSTPSPVAANALTLTSPASGATVSGTVNFTGQAGSDWVNVAAYVNGTKVGADTKPVNGRYSVPVNTSLIADGAATIAVTAFSVPAGQSGGTSSTVNLAVNVSNGSGSGGGGTGGSSSATTRNYLVGIFSDFTDTTTMNALGYQFDYTLNGSYQGDCLSCGWSGTTNYPMIIDLHHIETSYSDFNAAANGSYNSGYTSVVTSLVPYANNIYAVRIDSEFNGAWSQWSPWYNNYNYNNGVTPATWIAGFRNYALIVRQYLPNAKIVWNPNTGQTSPMDYYPGDDVVDIIGVDTYTNPQYNSNSTQATTEQISGDWGNAVSLVAFAKQHGKAFGIPEWGDTYGDGVFITAMGQFINDVSNNVVFHSFWDSNQDLTYPGQLAAWPTNEAAYVKAFGGKKYTGTYFKQVPIPLKSLKTK